MEIVAIIGRPNVGKSTLFNRIVGQKRAIVDEVAGVTRDRIYADVSFKKRSFILVDTGGFEPDGKEKIQELVLKQTEAAISEADKVIFLLDSKTGLSPDDLELGARLRKIQKEVFYCINKIDSARSLENINDFYSLGVDKFYHISSSHGTGVEELLSDISETIAASDTKAEPRGKEVIPVAIIGRPNVGKSLLLNRILNYERVMVDDRPGTTRDAIDTPFCYRGKDFLLIDTAGIRRRSKIDDELEGFSVMAALRAVEKSHIVIVVLDASLTIAMQDLRLVNFALDRGKGILFFVNKMDLIEERDSIDYGEFKKKIFRIYPSLSFAGFIFGSALTGLNVETILDEVQKIERYYFKKIPTGELNRFLKELKLNLKIGYVKGRWGMRGTVKYITQISSGPPRFVIFSNNPVMISKKHGKYIENQLRKKYIFTGVPIKIAYRK